MTVNVTSNFREENGKICEVSVDLLDETSGRKVHSVMILPENIQKETSLWTEAEKDAFVSDIRTNQELDLKLSELTGT